MIIFYLWLAFDFNFWSSLLIITLNINVRISFYISTLKNNFILINNNFRLLEFKLFDKLWDIRL